jgi:hypothetical protein
VLGQQFVSAPVTLHLRWWHDKRPSPYSTSGPSSWQKRAKRSQAHDSGTSDIALTPTTKSNLALSQSAKHDKPEGANLADIPGIVIPDRIYTRVLLRYGKPIDDFATPVELLEAMRDAVRGHQSLLVKGHVLHRDVSVNNILITVPTVSRPDRFKGFLIDLDHAVTSDGLGHHSGAPERTGMFEFMSTRALWPPLAFRHMNYNDLQSFMWVFFWLITYDRGHQLVGWSNPDPHHAAAYKAVQVQSETDFLEKLAANFDLRLGTAVVRAASDLRNAVSPADRLSNLDTELVRDRIYGDVIRAFSGALVLARKEADTLELMVVISRDCMAH